MSYGRTRMSSFFIGLTSLCTLQVSIANFWKRLCLYMILRMTPLTLFEQISPADMFVGHRSNSKNDLFIIVRPVRQTSSTDILCTQCCLILHVQLGVLQLSHK